MTLPLQKNKSVSINTKELVERLYAKEKDRLGNIEKLRQQIVEQELMNTKVKPDISKKSKILAEKVHKRNAEQMLQKT